MKTTIDKAPECLNTNDKAMWVTGWNEAVDALKEALAQPEQPEPKPDVVELHNVVIWGRTSTTIPNIKLTFDGETGELKSAEVI